MQEVRLDLEKAQRSSAHQLASSLLADALSRHTWSIQEQLAVIDNPDCPASSRGSEACIHAAFQSSMLQHMDNCFGFNLGSKPAPTISVRSLSVGSVSSVTAGDFSRAFISGCVVSWVAASSACRITESSGIRKVQLDFQMCLPKNPRACCRTRSSRDGAKYPVVIGLWRIPRPMLTMKILQSMCTSRCHSRPPMIKCSCCNEYGPLPAWHCSNAFVMFSPCFAIRRQNSPCFRL